MTVRPPIGKQKRYPALLLTAIHAREATRPKDRAPIDWKLLTAERLTNLLAIYCILSWRVFWLCMMNRAKPAASAYLAFTETEIQLLDHLIPTSARRKTKPISHYLKFVAKLGGYLARANDSPPGNMVLWRGFARLTDICLGFVIGAEFVGN